MRTHDRTYLASLGFADPDRKDDMHDTACLYLGQAEKSLKLLTKIYGEPQIKESFSSREENGAYDYDAAKKAIAAILPHKYIHSRSQLYVDVNVARSNPSWKFQAIQNAPLKKRQHYNGYETIVGYIDVFISASVAADERREYSLWLRDESEPHRLPDEVLSHPLVHEKQAVNSGLARNLFIEVKAGFTSISSVIQQISTYQHLVGYEYNPSFNKFILATLYPMSQMEKGELKNHGIDHIFLDRKDLEMFRDKHRVKVDESGF